MGRKGRDSGQWGGKGETVGDIGKKGESGGYWRKGERESETVGKKGEQPHRVRLYNYTCVHDGGTFSSDDPVRPSVLRVERQSLWRLSTDAFSLWKPAWNSYTVHDEGASHSQAVVRTLYFVWVLCEAMLAAAITVYVCVCVCVCV